MQAGIREKDWIGNESVRLRLLTTTGFTVVYLEGRQQTVRALYIHYSFNYTISFHFLHTIVLSGFFLLPELS